MDSSNVGEGNVERETVTLVVPTVNNFVHSAYISIHSSAIFFLRLTSINFFNPSIPCVVG